MNARVIAVSEIDISKITFVPGPSKPGRNPAINIKYEGQNLQLRVPRLNFPGGVMVRTDEKSGSTNYTLMGTLKDCDPYARDQAADTTEITKFYNFLLWLEGAIKAAAIENSPKWFGKKRSQEAIDDGFNRIIGTSKDNVDGEWVPNGKYPPSFKCKLPVYDGRVSSEFVDGKRNPIYATPESLTSIFTKGVEANLIVSGSIYVIAGGGFGVTWRLQKAQVFQRARITAADVFADEESDEPTVESKQTQTQEEDMPVESTPDDQPVQQVAPSAPARRRRQPASS